MKGNAWTLRTVQIALKICERPDYYTENDLAESFFTSNTSIRREIGLLKQNGIGAYSIKRKYRIIANDKTREWLQSIQDQFLLLDALIHQF